MANCRFEEGGEDRWYTLLHASMTIGEDGSSFEWAHWPPPHAVSEAPHYREPHYREQQAPLLDGVAAVATAAAAARQGSAAHKGGNIMPRGAAHRMSSFDAVSTPLNATRSAAVAAAAASAVANANAAINAASAIEAWPCGNGSGNGCGDEGEGSDTGDGGESSDEDEDGGGGGVGGGGEDEGGGEGGGGGGGDGGEGGAGPALPNSVADSAELTLASHREAESAAAPHRQLPAGTNTACPQLHRLEIGALAC